MCGAPQNAPSDHKEVPYQYHVTSAEEVAEVSSYSS